MRVYLNWKFEEHFSYWKKRSCVQRNWAPESQRPGFSAGLRRLESEITTQGSWAGLSNLPMLHLCWKRWRSVSTCCLSGCCFPNTPAMEQTSNPPLRIQCPAVIAAQESKDSDVPHHHCLSPAIHLPWAPHCLRSRAFPEQSFPEGWGLAAHSHDDPRGAEYIGQVWYRLTVILPALFLSSDPVNPLCSEKALKAPLLQPRCLLNARETKGREWLGDTNPYQSSVTANPCESI